MQFLYDGPELIPVKICMSAKEPVIIASSWPIGEDHRQVAIYGLVFDHSAITQSDTVAFFIDKHPVAVAAQI